MDFNLLGLIGIHALLGFLVYYGFRTRDLYPLTIVAIISSFIAVLLLPLFGLAMQAFPYSISLGFGFWLWAVLGLGHLAVCIWLTSIIVRARRSIRDNRRSQSTNP